MSRPHKIELETRFDHTAVDGKWYARWEESGAFTAEVDSTKAPFTMVIPPPNVTGALHMGHALNNTIQDIYARYWRMRGRDVLWLPGTDHAGIATQNVVEKRLAVEKVRREDLGREEFVARVWKWKEESGGTIVRQLRRLGASCDWSRERFTMDEGLSRAVVEVFVRLHEKGLIYRADRLVNWCTRCRTALSDIEVEHQESKGHFWHVRYPFADGGGYLEIATTRPETMLGDTAVAVHPEDERYRDIVGRHVLLPLLDRRIPVIADSYVDREFGTGVVKITPGHDPNDFEVGQRHGLPVIKAFTEDGRIAAEVETGAVPGAAEPFVGLSLPKCRERIVADLENREFLARVEDRTHAVGKCYRCHTPIEPYLTPQWFVRTAPLAEPAIRAVEEGRTRIVPTQWEKTYFEWMRNIRDWCVSRQIWWGHQIPAWYCRACDRDQIADGSFAPVIRKEAVPIVAREEPATCPRCGGSELVREPDVLDTWFSSALWPFSTLGWPEAGVGAEGRGAREAAGDLKRYYPTDLLVTGFDILFFWVARMMMMGIEFMGEVPFREVYIHALVRDAEGKKMSKSRGNVIDPLSVIDDLGADAFRFTLAAFAAQGRDIKLDEKRIEGYRNFVTKIWNAARLVLSHEASGPPAPRDRSNPEDRWILSRLSNATASVRIAIENYQIDRAADAIYAFFWREYCDWYLEIVKPRLRDGESAAVETARTVLADSIKLLHPFMPFVTEELHEKLGGISFLDHQPFPEILDRDGAIEAHFAQLQSVIGEIRRTRTEFKIPPVDRLVVYLVAAEELEPRKEIVERLANVEAHFVADRPALSHFSASVIGGVEIMLPLEGLIDLAKERARLEEEVREGERHVASSRARLANPDFAEKAPPEIVEGVRKTLIEREERLRRLGELLAGL